MNLRITLFLSLAAVACTGGNASKNEPSATGTTAGPRPDNNDLLEVLQGSWQSTDDSTYTIEIRGNKMRHINGGALSMETEIEVDGACEHTDCPSEHMVEGTWCFVEKSPDGNQCNAVDLADKQALQYHVIGAAGSGNLSFRKLN